MSLADLGRRAVACKHWRWMPGMLIIDHGAGTRFLWEDKFFLHGMHEESEGSWMRIRKDRERHPDLSDPATLGCLLALVEEQHGNVVLNESGGEWECWIYLGNGRGMFQYSGGTRVEALVAALEAAP